MANWKKVTLSGSNAQVTSSEILVPLDESFTALQVDNGKVFFPNLQSQTSSDASTFPLGTVMTSAQESYVMITEVVPGPGSGYQIPWNWGLADANGDGTIATADLLLLLGVFGNQVAASSSFDYNGDGEIGSADLIYFLTAYGASLEGQGDTRPYINWCATTGWIDPFTNKVTKESAGAYFDSVGSEAFWNAFGYNDSDVSTSVYAYIAQGATPTKELFLYIYFSQTTGGPYGGCNYYNRDGAVSGNPIGYSC